MKRNFVRVLVVLLVVALAVTAFVGCKKKNNNNSSDNNTPTTVNVTVRFNVEGAGDVTLVADSEGNISVTGLTVPDGYTLEGLYTDEAFTQEVDLFSFKASANMTLYAKLVQKGSDDPIAFSITIKWGLAGVEDTTITADLSGNVSFANLQLPQGYTLEGLYYDAALSDRVDVDNLKLSANMTLFAKLAAEQVAHQHRLSKVEEEPATADKDGHKAYWVCADTACGKAFSDANGEHEIADLTAWLAGEGKLEKTGGQGEDQPQHQHTLVKVPQKNPTATEDGYLEYWVCSDADCNKAFSDAEGQNEINVERWKQQEGKLSATGSQGGEDNPPQPQHQHRLSKVEEEPATADKDGHKAYWVCADEACNKAFSDANGEHEIADLQAWLAGEGKLEKTGQGGQDNPPQQWDGNLWFDLDGVGFPTTDGSAPFAYVYYNDYSANADFPGQALTLRDGKWFVKTDLSKTIELVVVARVSSDGVVLGHTKDILAADIPADHVVFVNEMDAVQQPQSDRALLTIGEANQDLEPDVDRPDLKQFKLLNVQLSDGDKPVVTFNGKEIPFAAELEGEGSYDFYLNVTEEKVYFVKHAKEEKAFLFVGDNSQEMAVDVDRPDLKQFMVGGVEIAADDQVKVVFGGKEIAFAEGFALSGEGIYDFYFNVDDNAVYTVKHEKPAPEDKAVVIIGEAEIEMIVDVDRPDLKQFKALGVEVAKGDKPVVKLNDVEVAFAEGHGLDGEGKYDLYLNATEKLVYAVKQEQPQEQQEDNAVVAVNGNVIPMDLDADCSFKQFKAMDVEVPENVREVRITLNGEAVAFAEGHGLDGAGTYDLYLNAVEGKVYAVKHVEPVEPQEDKAVMEDNGDSIEMIVDDNPLNAEERQYKLENVEIGEDSAPVFKFNAVAVPFAEGYGLDGAGTYNFYLNVTQNKVYAVKQVEAQEPQEDSASLKLGEEEPVAMVLDDNPLNAETKQFKLENVEVDDPEQVVIKLNDEALNFAEGHGLNGAGTYSFYVNVSERLVYAVKHVEPEEPQEDRAFVIVVEAAQRMERDEDRPYINQFKALGVEVSAEQVADTRVEFNGKAVPFAEGNGLDGAGTYDFYLNADENLVYAVKFVEPQEDRIFVVALDLAVGMERDEEKPYINQFKALGVKVSEEQVADTRVEFNGKAVPFAEGNGLDGAGTYDFYLNADENKVYVVKHVEPEQPQEPQEDRAILTVGLDGFKMIKDEDKPYINQFKALEIEVADKDEVSVTFNGKDVPFAEGNEIKEAGKYNFYLNADENKVYAVKIEEQPEQPEEPQGDAAVLKIGKAELPMGRDPERPYMNQFVALEVEITEADVEQVSVLLNGKEAPFAKDNEIKKAGTYNFYLNADENLVYVVEVEKKPEQPEEPEQWDGNLIFGFGAIDYLEADGCTPYAYIYFADHSKNAEFPGEPLTKVGEKELKWQISVDPTKEIALIVVSRVSKDGTKVYNQTEDIKKIPANHMIEITEMHKVDITIGEPENPEQPGEDEPQSETVFVIYQKTNSEWGKVYAYAWTGEGEATVEFLGAFPGREMNPANGSTEWYAIEVNAMAKYIIFSNGQGGEGNQTENLSLNERQTSEGHQYVLFGDASQIPTGESEGEVKDPDPEQPGENGEQGNEQGNGEGQGQEQGQEAQAWDGTLTVEITWPNFNDAPADAYLYVWYVGADGQEERNADFPGVKMDKNDDGTWTGKIDTSKRFAGMIVSRCNPENGQKWNQSGNIDSIPEDHVIEIAEMK